MVGWGCASRACGAAPGQEAEDAAEESVEGGAGVALAEVRGGEATNETVDLEAGHCFVAEAKAGERCAAEMRAPADVEGAILEEREDGGPVKQARATGKGGEMVRVFEIFGKHGVAGVEEGSECEGGGVPDAPRVVKLV
jgi:hypothetical protein